LEILVIMLEALDSDINEIVNLHMANVSPSEFSMLFNGALLPSFYRLAVNSPYAKLFLLRDSNGQLFGSFLYFTNYSKFLKLFYILIFPTMFFNLIISLFLHPKSFFFFIRYFLRRSLYKIPDAVYPYHMGYMILDQGARADQNKILSFFNCYKICFDDLLRSSKCGIWTSVFADNISSLKVINFFFGDSLKYLYSNFPKATFIFLKCK